MNHVGTNVIDDYRNLKKKERKIANQKKKCETVKSLERRK
jgi:hypothetical protein